MRRMTAKPKVEWDDFHSKKYICLKASVNKLPKVCVASRGGRKLFMISLCNIV
jgi:hypothetical protein